MEPIQHGVTLTLKISLNPEKYPSSLNPCFAALPKGAGNPAAPGKLLNHAPVLDIIETACAGLLKILR